jgi:hypothetical protein
MSTSNIKTLTFKFEVSVQVDGTSEKERLENGKKAVIEKLQNGPFPSFSYTVTDGVALEPSEATSGTIVHLAELKEDGIIYGINPKSVSIALQGGRHFTCKVAGLTKSSATAENFFVSRPDWMKTGDMGWEGYMGYLKVEGGKFVPVVIGKKKGAKTPAYIINGGGRHYPLSEKDMLHLVDEMPSKGK